MPAETTAPAFDYDAVRALRPCSERFHAATKALGGVEAWKARAFTFAEMAAAGVPFDDLLWLAGAAARTDPDVARRLRLWAADCAARVLHIYERAYPCDERQRAAIVAARQYARGEIGEAARDAAWDAAWAAAWAAAGDAAWAAAGDAAWAAAGAVARAVARAAAWAAAGNAAGAIAWAAAGNAAGAVAWAAAGDAAWNAAGAVEREWQSARFIARMSADEPADWPLDAPAIVAA